MDCYDVLHIIGMMLSRCMEQKENVQNCLQTVTLQNNAPSQLCAKFVYRESIMTAAHR